MQPIGILAVVSAGTPEEAFAVINPERMYFVVPPDQCPDELLTLMSQVRARGDVEPLGVIIDGGKVS